MTAVINQPSLVEGLSLLGWRLKRDAEIRERKDEPNFECEVEPSSTSYAAFEYMSTTDDDYDPYAGINLDLCLEVDAIDLNVSSQQTNDDYDPYEVFMRMNTRRTVTGRDRAPLALVTSHPPTNSSLISNYRHYNFADDDTPVKYPLAIGLVDKNFKQPQQQQQQQQNIRGGYTSRPSFDDDHRSRGGLISRPTLPSSYRQSASIIPRRGGGGPLPYTGIRRPIPAPPPRLYPRSEYPLNSSSKRVTFRQSNDYNSGDDLDFDEEDEDSLERDFHQQSNTRRNKPPTRTAARIATQRFRANHPRSSLADDDLDDDIAPTVTEMDMLEDEEDEDEPNTHSITKSMSSPVKLAPPPPPQPMVMNKPTSSKSSYIGNMLPSFYEQLSESKKMLLQDATIDSSSTQTDRPSKNVNEITTSPKKVGLTTEHIEGPGGEEIIDEENRLQFQSTTPTQGYKRSNNLQGTKRYYENDDDDDEQHQMRKRNRVNEEDYINRNAQYQKQQRYRRYEEDEEYDIHQDAQQQQQQEEEFQQTVRIPARRGRPPSQHHQQQQQQEDPSKRNARIISQFEEQHGLKLGDMRVFAPKLRLRISSVNVNWINLPPIPKFPNKVHES